MTAHSERPTPLGQHTTQRPDSTELCNTMGNVYGAYDKPTAHVNKIETMDPPSLKDDNMRRLYILLIIAVNAYLQVSSRRQRRTPLYGACLA